MSVLEDDIKHNFYHLNIFGKNWVSHGKKLFDKREEALECLKDQIKINKAHWLSKKRYAWQDLLNEGFNLIKIDGRKFKNPSKFFLDADFVENPRVAGNNE